jgi:hypothetical protein
VRVGLGHRLASFIGRRSRKATTSAFLLAVVAGSFAAVILAGYEPDLIGDRAVT